MALSVIGAGYPRTGTASLKAALEQLSLGPCYHMSEVFAKPAHWPMWIAAGEGRHVDWDVLFEGYRASTDAPGCMFYRQIAAHYPTAKVVLSTRDPERWFESTQATILSQGLAHRHVERPPQLLAMLRAIGWHSDDPATHDKETMVARLNAHNAEVKRTIPPERLLVYEASQGWRPLCEFLDLPVPDAPFPHINSTEEFNKMIAGAAGADPTAIKRSFSEQAARQARAKKP